MEQGSSSTADFAQKLSCALSNPFELCLWTLSPSAFNSRLYCGENVRTWGTFIFPNSSGFNRDVLEVLRIWFLSLRMEPKEAVFVSHMKKPIEDACSIAFRNSGNMFQLITLLKLQHYFSVTLFIPSLVNINDSSSIDRYWDREFGFYDFLKDSHPSQHEKLMKELEHILSLDEQTLYDYMIKKYTAADSITVPKVTKNISNFLSRYKQVFVYISKEQYMQMLCFQFDICLDPFQHCLQLLSCPNWQSFQFPSEGCHDLTILQGFANWFKFVCDPSKILNLFCSFMALPISNACMSGNFVSMCQLITLLGIQELFAPYLCLIPTELKDGNSEYVLNYLKGCKNESLLKNIMRQLDALLTLEQTELDSLAEKYSSKMPLNHETLAESIDLHKQQFDLSDQDVPNLTARKVKGSENSSSVVRESVSFLLSSNGPWKDLAPPMRRIRLYKITSD